MYEWFLEIDFSEAKATWQPVTDQLLIIKLIYNQVLINNTLFLSLQWQKNVVDFDYKQGSSYFSLLVPTVDTVLLQPRNSDNL
jgi:hypothetical protein